MPARSKPFDAQKSVHDVCVSELEEKSAPANRRPLAPSRRQRLVFCQPLASGAGVDEMAGLWKMLRAWPPPQIFVWSPEQAVKSGIGVGASVAVTNERRRCKEGSTHESCTASRGCGQRSCRRSSILRGGRVEGTRKGQCLARV